MIEWFKKVSKTILIIILAIVSFLYFKSCNKNIYYKNAYQYEHDSLVSYVNKDGLNESKIKELELDKKDLKHLLDTIKITTKTKTVTQIKTKTEFVEVVTTSTADSTISAMFVEIVTLAVPGLATAFTADVTFTGAFTRTRSLATAFTADATLTGDLTNL